MVRYIKGVSKEIKTECGVVSVPGVPDGELCLTCDHSLQDNTSKCEGCRRFYLNEDTPASELSDNYVPEAVRLSDILQTFARTDGDVTPAFLECRICTHMYVDGFECSDCVKSTSGSIPTKFEYSDPDYDPDDD